jgi:RNA polymerase sigma-70 factor (ECF subfamily)
MPESTPVDPVAEAFESQRDRLRAVAHRLLGSYADAEDVVQEAWLRLSRQDTAAIHNLGGWLTTVVGRISLDVLRARRARPETPYDTGLPEIVLAPDEGPAPETDTVLGESVGLALLVVLESLRPGERLAFVLHDLFGVPFDEIGRILGKSADASKMLASRARRKVRGAGRPECAAPERRDIIHAFLAAARDGDFAGLLRVLDPDVRLTARTAAGEVVTLGATRVAAGARLGAAAASAVLHDAIVGGLPGIVAYRPDGTPLAALSFTIPGPRITSIHTYADPALLASLPPAPRPPAEARATPHGAARGPQQTGAAPHPGDHPQDHRG